MAMKPDGVREKRSDQLGAVAAPRHDAKWLRAAIGRLVEIAEASDATAGTALYLFGSSCRGHTTPSDIDILLIYPNGHLPRVRLLAESIRSAATSLMFDVSVLSSTEEHELAFIQIERASRIWSR